MANKKLTDLPELLIPANDDWFYVVDKSDLTESPQGTSKKIKKGNALTNDILKEDVINKSDSYTTSSSTTYSSTKALVDGLATKIGGSGSANYLPIFTGSNYIGSSLIQQVPSLSGNTGNNIFLGTTAETARDARFYSNIPSILTNYGGHTFGDYTPISQTAGGDGSSAYASFDSKAVMSGAGNFNHFISFQARNEFTGSNTLGSFEGLRTSIIHNGLGTVTNAIGVRLYSKQGTGAITNLYGLKVDGQSGATNNYAIFTDTGLVRFGDDTSVIGNISSTGTSSASNFSSPAGSSGAGYRFYGTTDDYKIYMASATDGTNGGRMAGETISDFNMYFKMGNAIKRGFVWKAGATPTVIAGLDYLGNFRATSFTGTATLTGTPTAPTATAGTNTTQIATTAFVQTVVRPYKVYTALLTQSGTAAPTDTVLENTLGGTVVWSRTSAGSYLGTLTGVFTASKTFCTATLGTYLSGGSNSIALTKNSVNDVFLFTNRGTVGTDAILNNASIEIRVYN